MKGGAEAAKGPALRASFVEAHPDVRLLDGGAAGDIEAYLLERRVVRESELPIGVEPAGDGNMNLTLRVTLADRSVILKQGRPWVEKYDHIAAPWGRTLIEGRFYTLAAGAPGVSMRLPRLLDLDERNQILALEDLGRDGDLSTIYRDGGLATSTLLDLLEWLATLARLDVPTTLREALANREMRALNHAHMFVVPLDEHNGLDLDGLTPGLAAAARAVQCDREYTSRVARLGATYLSDGPCLVHGDFFPGSWIRTAEGVRVIDPEFCFLGSREFDYGIMLGHLALAAERRELAEQVLASATTQRLDERLVMGFAGTEIMRRLIGVAQLPLACGIDVKRRMLDVSRQLVLSPERGLPPW
jgi:5-methylthioribose kinase